MGRGRRGWRNQGRERSAGRSVREGIWDLRRVSAVRGERGERRGRRRRVAGKDRGRKMRRVLVREVRRVNMVRRSVRKRWVMVGHRHRVLIMGRGVAGIVCGETVHHFRELCLVRSAAADEGLR